MVEAGAHHIALEPRQAVRPQGRAEQVHVGRIGQQTVLHLRPLPFGRFHSEPKLVFVGGFLGREEVTGSDLAQLDGTLAQEVIVIFLGNLGDMGFAQLVPVRPVFGAAHLRHRVLVVPALFIHMK